MEEDEVTKYLNLSEGVGETKTIFKYPILQCVLPILHQLYLRHNTGLPSFVIIKVISKCIAIGIARSRDPFLNCVSGSVSRYFFFDLSRSVLRYRNLRIAYKPAPSNIKFGVWSWESPAWDQPNLVDTGRIAYFFNWTMTYRWDSKTLRTPVVNPYGYIAPIENVPL